MNATKKNPRLLACPTCGANAGARCRGVATHHRARSQLVKRQDAPPLDLAPEGDLVTRTNDMVVALAKLKQHAERVENADLACRCGAAQQALLEPSKIRCRVCGQEIPPGMVRMAGPEGFRHVTGAFVCRTGS